MSETNYYSDVNGAEAYTRQAGSEGKTSGANASYLGSYGNAANTVVFPLTVIALAMISTLAGAAVNMILDPIFGQAIYAQKLFTYLLTWEIVVGAVALFVAECLPGQLIQIFGAANESSYYTEFALKAFRVYLCMLIAACVNKATFIYLQSLGKLPWQRLSIPIGRCVLEESITFSLTFTVLFSIIEYSRA